METKTLCGITNRGRLIHLLKHLNVEPSYSIDIDTKRVLKEASADDVIMELGRLLHDNTLPGKEHCRACGQEVAVDVDGRFVAHKLITADAYCSNSLKG